MGKGKEIDYSNLHLIIESEVYKMMNKYGVLFSEFFIRDDKFKSSSYSLGSKIIKARNEFVENTMNMLSCSKEEVFSIMNIKNNNLWIMDKTKVGKTGKLKIKHLEDLK